MFFVVGSRLLGHVDEVPGLFHVATRFGHFNFLPLIPMQSYVVLGKKGASFRGVPIPLSFKSIFMAWARVVCFLATLGGIFGALAVLERGPEHWIPLAALGVFGAVGFAMTMWHHRCTHASFERACQLAQLIGLNEHGLVEIHRIYGQAPTRGFDVVPVAAIPPPLPQGARATFMISGTYKQTGQPACFTAFAESAEQARRLGDDRGINVTDVEVSPDRGPFPEMARASMYP